MKQSAPLSQSQYGIYVECTNHQGEVYYNLPFLFALDPSLDGERLRQAVETTVRNHPTLFTRIEVDAEGEPLQTIDLDKEEWTLQLEEIDSIDAVKDELCYPFNVVGDRLFHIRLLHDKERFYLFCDIHHIINDGSSLNLWVYDVKAAYGGETLAEEQMTLMDWAKTEATLRQQDEYEKAKQWYAEHFDCGETYTPLKADLDSGMKTKDDERKTKGDVSRTKTLKLDLAEVEEFCRANQIFKSTFFTAAYALLLARFNGEQESLFNTVYNGRADSRLAHTLGMFVKTFPVYMKFDDSTTVLDFMRVCQENMKGCREHDIYSYGDAIRDLGLQIPTDFVWHGNLLSYGDFSGKPMSYEMTAMETRISDIYFRAYTLDGQVQLEAEYNAYEYSLELVDTIMDSYEAVVRELMNKEKVVDIDISTEAEVAKLDSFNETDVPYDDSQTLVSLFRNQVAATPDNIAVVFKEKRYTYKEVDEISECLAAYLYGKGVGQGDVVSVLIARSEWMAIASLGVLKTGAAYQPLDPSYPKERLNFMVKDADAKMLIADEELSTIVDEYEGEVLLTKDIGEMKNVPSGWNGSSLTISPQDRYILLYTSGSTGVPKGCQLCHGNMVCYCHWYQRYVELKAGSRVAAYASYGFDACMMDMYPALTCGATVHIIPEEIRLDFIALNDYFEREQITHSFMTTQVGYQFATSIENHSLLHLSVGGEKLASLAVPTSFGFHNFYGPTECTIAATAYTLKEYLNDIPIGQALDNMRLYVVDKQGRRQPVGASGELWISGPQVGLGYLNRPEKTAEVFIANPFTKEEKYARVYRTGDIVRYLPDGNIQFIGRRDGQVKIRGFRIELKEVESIIRQFPGIKDVTVQAFEDENAGGKFIAAYIVSDETINIDALNQFILEEKPPYMVPAVTMQIDAIPLNQNQKVNKKALPKPEVSLSSAMDDAGSAPLNVLEQQIMDMVSGIVGHSNFGITTVLGYVGLTSISSIKLAVLINNRFGVTLHAKELVKTGSIQSIENEILKHLLSSQNEAPETADAQTSSSQPQSLSYPLSDPQQGVYVDCLKNPASTTYNIPMMTKLPEGTDIEKIKSAIRTFVKYHPELTISFGSEGTEVVQTLHPDMEFDIPVLKLSEEDIEHEKREFVKPFNLNQYPLFRFEIIDTAKSCYLLFDFHHLVADGASIDLFFRQFCDLMEGKEIDAEMMSYGEFVEAERKADKSEDAQFFLEQLKDVEGVTELTSDLIAPTSGDDNQGKAATVTAPIDWQEVEAFCQQHGITGAHLLLSSVFYTLSRFANSSDVTLVTISNGRSNISIYNTMGMFVNTLAMRAKISDEKVLDFIKNTSRTFDDTRSHENYPFAKIAADFDLSAEIMFAYQMGVMDEYTIDGKQLLLESLEAQVPKFPIAIFIQEVNGQPSVQLEYDDSKYSKDMMQQLAISIVNVTQNLMEHADAPLTSISLINAEQLAQLDSFNDNHVAFDASQTIVSLFRQQVEKYRNHTAVVYEDQRFTYEEVDALSNKIAQHLISKGVKQGDVVSVLIPRCQWMPIASLGVLKAGCAYQPLDPSYPEERLNFMMKDADAQFLIADEELRPVVNEYEGEVLLTKDIADLPEVSSAQVDSFPSISPSDLFILLYTSGSTGTPKGCQWEHRNIVAFCNWYRRKFELDANCRVSAYASYGFDACQMDMYSALTSGATSYIVPESVRLNLPNLAEFYENEGITHAFMTTQIAYQFATTQKCSSLRWLLTGGEKLASLTPPENYTLVNIYGPTECTICITTYDVKQTLGNIPIGIPTDNTQIYIVDTNGHRLPVGAAGELWTAGPQVSRGYLNRPEKTKEVYISNPFGEGTVYRTGDIVRYLSDGNIQFIGRRDGQVKIRGFRIELKEVEAVIREYPGIKDATVQAFEYENGGKYIAAYVVSDEQIDIQELNDFIAERKPSYMVPAATMQIDRIPLNQNQKVNRKALPAPVITASNRDYVEPANELEKLFCDIFQKILSMDQVGATDNFFDLGGTSLMATRLIIEADQAGHHVAYGDIFDHSTPRQLAHFLNGETVSTKETQKGPLANDQTITHYDYTSIHTLLKGNTLRAFKEGEMQSMHHVLLTGATGFLGIHVLYELIQSDVETIYCLVRGKTESDAKERLKTLLYYYFETNFQELFDSGRLVVIAGDVTQNLSDVVSGTATTIDTVFNCAAIVKHFSKGTEIEDVNIGGAMECVKLCLSIGARLVHVSTYSTAGFNIGQFDPDTVFDEQKLYFGQYMDNAYINSKFISERIVLQAVATHGLSAKVVRVGNLAPRSTDGEFQINFQTNSAMGRVRAFKILGGYTYEECEQPMEFSPINEVARAIVLLSGTPKACCLFHPFNNHSVLFDDVMNELKVIGEPPRLMEEEEFVQQLNEAKNDPQKAPLLTGLLAYEDMSHGQRATFVPTINHYTTAVLLRLGFRWSPTSWNYVDSFLVAISRLGFFN